MTQIALLVIALFPYFLCSVVASFGSGFTCMMTLFYYSYPADMSSSETSNATFLPTMLLEDPEMSLGLYSSSRHCLS